MSEFPELFPKVNSNRVNPVGRVTADSLPPVLRGTDGIHGGYPLPKKVQLEAEDVALFERLVFGDAYLPKLTLIEGWVGPETSALGIELTGSTTADRIASTLHHLGSVRGL